MKKHQIIGALTATSILAVTLTGCTPQDILNHIFNKQPVTIEEHHYMEPIPTLYGPAPTKLDIQQVNNDSNI